MPLAAERLRERGYNQAWELARRLGAALGCAADARLLLRIRNTPHQTTLALSARAANVQGAFAVEPRRLAEVRGRELTLVDDVMTTGASAAEATRVLLQAGAARVQVWVVARTPRPGSACCRRPSWSSGCETGSGCLPVSAVPPPARRRDGRRGG